MAERGRDETRRRMTWQPITYDPELNLIYVATGNPQPVIAHKNRAGANLYTESIVALNPDTGKMVWYFQASPHGTHDWDATQVPVLFDGEVNGQKRKPSRKPPQRFSLCLTEPPAKTFSPLNSSKRIGRKELTQRATDSESRERAAIGWGARYA